MNSPRQLSVAVCLSLALIAAAPPKAKEEITLSSKADASRVLVYQAPIDYPIEARRGHVTGSGSFQMILSDTGKVEDVLVRQSTGRKILDTAAVQTLLKWRFKPHLGIRRANLRISFTLSSR
jgi:protein TonB